MLVAGITSWALSQKRGCGRPRGGVLKAAATMRTWTAAALTVLVAGAAHAADLPETYDKTGTSASTGDMAIRTYAMCREAIAAAAADHAALDIQTVLVGPVRRSTFTTRTAPLHVRITYATDQGQQVRQSAVDCRVARNKVVSITPRADP